MYAMSAIGHHSIYDQVTSEDSFDLPLDSTLPQLISIPSVQLHINHCRSQEWSVHVSALW